MRMLLPLPLCFLVVSLPFMAETAPHSQPASPLLPSSSSFHVPENQKFVYSVAWRRLNAGTATILIEHTPSAEHLHSTADTSGITNKIYPVHDTFDAEIDPHTLCTLAVSRHSEEGSRRVDRKIHFDYSAAKSRVDEFDLRTGTKRHSEFDIPACLTDVVSGFFYASSLPLAPGFSETFPVSEGGKTSGVKITVEGRERVKVPFGEFDALRARAEPISGPIEGKGKLWVWFTDDSRKIPVKINAKLGFATLVFELDRIETATGGK